MIQAIFRFLINLLATLIQVVLTPINLLFTTLMPDISSEITNIAATISQFFSGMYWAIGMLPTELKVTLITILTIEIAKHTIWANSHMIVKVWNVLQKIKFW